MVLVMQSASASGPEGQGREEGEGGDQDDRAADQDAEQRAGRWAGCPRRRSTRRCAASEPASASTARIGTNRPSSMQRPRVAWKKSLVTVSPANALPLLFAAEA